MRTIRYLAYGSNLLPARLRARLQSIRVLGAAALPGWQLHFHKRGADGSGKCNLVQTPGGVAYGAVYELSLEAKAQLDEIEGLGKGYRDAVLMLADHGEAHVYLAEPAHIDDALIPYDWYHAFVLAGGRHHGFPARYLERIAVIPVDIDPNERRRRVNQGILNVGDAD
jgi:hypothetical protein